MSRNLELACSCGSVRGRVREANPEAVNHAVCYCDDCQSFAHFLGKPAEILDEHGGTEIVQVAPPTVEITDGWEHVAAMRLTPKGLVRWYATCCNSPLFNMMMSPKVPFVGVFYARITSPAPPETLVGPIRGRANARFAKRGSRPLPADAAPRVGVRLLARSARVLFRWWRAGGTSPLRDAAGSPRVAPTVLPPDELARVIRERDAWGG